MKSGRKPKAKVKVTIDRDYLERRIKGLVEHAHGVGYHEGFDFGYRLGKGSTGRRFKSRLFKNTEGTIRE